MSKNTLSEIASYTWQQAKGWATSAFVVVILFTGLAIVENSLRYFSSTNVGFLRTKADVIHGTPYLPAFYAHITVGFIVLVTGLLSFSRRIRRRHSAVHRMAGKVYVALVLLLMAPSGLIMGLYANGGFTTRLCFVLLAGLWGYYTAQAYRAIRQGKVTNHKVHMQRSYALALSAIMLRVYSFLAAYCGGLRGPEIYQILVWLSWVPNLLLVALYQYAAPLIDVLFALPAARAGAQSVARRASAD